MHVLLIAQEPPMAPGGVVTGNAIRTRQLSDGLRGGGHEVTQLHLSREPATCGFRNRDELRSLILRHRPDILLVSYWELLALLPANTEQQVILDFLAPRPLEQLFEQPAQAEIAVAALVRAAVSANEELGDPTKTKG